MIDMKIKTRSRMNELVADMIDEMSRSNIGHEPQIYRFEDSRGVKLSVRSRSPEEALERVMKMTHYQIVDFVII